MFSKNILFLRTLEGKRYININEPDDVLTHIDLYVMWQKYRHDDESCPTFKAYYNAATDKSGMIKEISA